MLCMRTNDTWSEPDPISNAGILIIDTQENNEIKHIATTHT